MIFFRIMSRKIEETAAVNIYRLCKKNNFFFEKTFTQIVYTI
jgi:hypothetical protein